jgi:hypothetical protein
MRVVSKITDRLNGTISLINEYHVFNPVITLLDLLFVVITTTFLIYDVTVHSLNANNFFIIFGGFAYAINSGLICIFIFVLSSRIQSIYSEIEMKILGCAEISKFSQLFAANFQRNEISCGLFKFEWAHIFTMLTSFVAYLIVMLQFDLMINVD